MFYLFLAKDFEEIEALATVDILRRAKIDVLTVGIDGKTVTGAHGITVSADISADEVDPVGAVGIILPGGPGRVNLFACQAVKNMIQFSYENQLYICAICGAPEILGQMGLLKGKTVTAFPDSECELTGAIYTGAPAETDGKIITGKGAGTTVEFALHIVSAVLGTDAANELRGKLQCPQKT